MCTACADGQSSSMHELQCGHALEQKVWMNDRCEVWLTAGACRPEGCGDCDCSQEHHVQQRPEAAANRAQRAPGHEPAAGSECCPGTYLVSMNKKKTSCCRWAIIPGAPSKETS